MTRTNADPAAPSQHPQDVLNLEPSPSFVMTIEVESIARRALSYLQAGYPVHFAGPPGVGKTTALLGGSIEYGACGLDGEEIQRIPAGIPNVFEYFVSTFPELREARDAIADINRAEHSELLALGQLFERILTTERQQRLEQVRGVLAAHGVELKSNPPRSEREVMNLACLLPHAAQDSFESIVGEAAAAFDNHFTFDISGPWTPHNFVELSLRT